MATKGPKRKLEPPRGQKPISSFFALKSKVSCFQFWLSLVFLPADLCKDFHHFENGCQQEGNEERSGARGSGAKGNDLQREQGEKGLVIGFVLGNVWLGALRKLSICDTG